MLRHLPNAITVMRVVLIAPLIWLLLNRHYDTALIIFFIAGVSDAIDGFLAKHFNWQSRFGEIADPLADKLLLVITMLLLAYNQHLSWWLVGLVTLRDLVIVLGAYIYHRAMGPYKMAPSRLSKLNTFLQISLLVTLLVSLGVYPLPAWILDFVLWSVYISTVSSGIHYIVLWGGRYQRNRKQMQKRGSQ